MRLTEIVVGTDGRDKGKQFSVTEMSAFDAEWWGKRARMALIRTGMDVVDAGDSGMAAIAAAGIKVLMLGAADSVKPLYDEMLACVRHIPDPRFPEVSRPVIGTGAAQDDIEEVATLLHLRDAAFDLQFRFFKNAAPSAPKVAAEKAETSTGQTVLTRRGRSSSSSAPA